MSRMIQLRPKLYFAVYRWMLGKLNLKGNSVLVVAYLYAESSNRFSFVSPKEIGEALSMPVSTVYDCLKKLYEEGLVVRVKELKNNRTWKYRINTDVINKRAFSLPKKS